MTGTLFPSLDGLRPNPDWAKLPLFDRRGWKRVRFGDVVENVNVTERNPSESGIERFIGLEHLEPGSLHIRAWGNVADGTTFTRRCQPGQVLFGKRRAYQRKVAVAEFDAVVSGDIYVFAPKNDRLLPGLLPFLCMSERFFQHAVGTSAGSLSPRTNWSSLVAFEFGLPPLDQQHRIAEIPWAVDEVTERTYKVLKTTLALRKTAHHEVFTIGLADHIEIAKRGKYNEELPQGWRWSMVGKACLIENRLRKPINAEERASMQGAYPYFGPTGILDHLSDYRVDGEYVLIGEDGDHFLKFDTWNMTQLVRGRFNVNNHAHLLRGRENCRTEWIFQYFKHRDITPFLSRQGAGRLKLQKAVLERIPIVVPPLHDQDAILEFLRGIDENMAVLSERLKATQAMLSAFITQMMG